jgi:hypothetical protein
MRRASRHDGGWIRHDTAQEAPRCIFDSSPPSVNFAVTWLSN